MLQFDIRHLAVCHFLSSLFTVDYMKCVLLNCSAGIRVRVGVRVRFRFRSEICQLLCMCDFEIAQHIL